jgi:formylmethanofuran dehydrogenase subunit B
MVCKDPGKPFPRHIIAVLGKININLARPICTDTVATAGANEGAVVVAIAVVPDESVRSVFFTIR